MNDAPLSRSRRYALIVAVFLCVWATRTWTIGKFGSDLPYWDQWPKEGEMVFQPWFERHELWHNLFVPHNEHRIAPTLALNFALMQAGGQQWDARVQCVVNAALFAAIAAGFAAWVLRRLTRSWALAICGVIAAIGAAPIPWENLLGGFQSCFYFLIAASLAAMVGLLHRRAFSWAWLGGGVAAAVAIVSLGSGMLVAAPIIGIAAFRLLRPREPQRSRSGTYATLIVAAMVGAIGWWLRPQAPWHATLHASSLAPSALYFVRCLAWPLYGSPWLAGIFWAPWLVLAVRFVIGARQPVRWPQEFVIALGTWVLLQTLAATYARSGGSELPAPRYGDLFALGLFANAFALALLANASASAKEPSPAPPMKPAASSIPRAYAGAWFASVVIALAFGSVIECRTDLPRRHEATTEYEKNVGTFVLTDDYAWLDKQQPHLPFPFTDWLGRELRNPSLRRILPASVHLPLRIPNFGSEPDRPAGMPPLGNRPTRLVREGEAWQSEAIEPSTGYWKIETAGDAGRTGATLELVSVNGGRTLASIAPTKHAGNAWRAAYVAAPRERAYLRAKVEGSAEWIAFSEPVPMSSLSYWTWRFTQNAQWLALAAAIGLVCLVFIESRETSARRGGWLRSEPDRVETTAANPSGPHPDRVYGLDALRTTAILCVVLAHGGLQFVLGDVLQKIPLIGRYAGWSSLVGHGGAVGVEIFFVLSGFLIGGILLRSGQALGTRDGLIGFYVRRWFRTLPLFALALGANVLFEQYVREHALTGGEIAGHGFFLRNFSHISLTFFPESWSLAVEEWFYLLFPAALFLALATFRAKFGRAFVGIAVFFFLFSTAMRVWGAFQPGATWAGTARCTVIYRFDALMAGVVAAWTALNHPAVWQRWARPLKFVGLALFFGGYAAWWTFHVDGPAEAPDSFFARTFRFTIMSVSIALLLPALSQWIPRTEGVVHRAVRRIALWSYALYLVHWPLFQIVGGEWSKEWQATLGAWYFVGKVALAIALAAILHVAFEAPAMRLRNRLRTSRVAARAEPAGAAVA